jgi:hypothetical protein
MLFKVNLNFNKNKQILICNIMTTPLKFHARKFWSIMISKGYFF